MPFADVAFTTTDGIVIRGWFSGGSTGALVVLLHGWASNREGLLPEAEMLASAGFGVLLFDWRAHGESGGDRCTWGVEEPRDLEAALSWIEGEHPGYHVGALGFSMGGMVLVDEAAQDLRIEAVALEGTYPTLADVGYQMEDRFGPFSGIPAVWALRLAGIAVDTVRPVDNLKALGPRPLLMIYGSKESAPRYDLTGRMSEAACAPSKKPWIVPGAAHGEYAKVAPEELKTRLVSFFSAALKPRER